MSRFPAGMTDRKATAKADPSLLHPTDDDLSVGPRVLRMIMVSCYFKATVEVNEPFELLPRKELFPLETIVPPSLGINAVQLSTSELLLT